MKEIWYVWYNSHTKEGGFKYCTWKEIEPISRTHVQRVSNMEEAREVLAIWEKENIDPSECIEEDRHGYPYCKTHDCGADWPCGEESCPHCKGIL